MLGRAREQYETKDFKHSARGNETPSRLTRSKTSPFNRDKCFFVTAVSLAGKPFYFCYPVLTYRISATTEMNLRKGMLLTMSKLYYSGIFMGEFLKVHEDVCNRKTLKPLTQILIPEVEFHRPPKANESDRLSI